MKVHIIIEATSEDYHGTYKEFIAVYGDKTKAENEVSRLIEENHNGNVDYYYETRDVL
jgi:hypothetical protein